MARPTGTGKYGVKTKPMRVPIIIWDIVLAFINLTMRKRNNETDK